MVSRNKASQAGTSNECITTQDGHNLSLQSVACRRDGCIDAGFRQMHRETQLRGRFCVKEPEITPQ